MATSKSAHRKQLTIRPRFLALCIIALGVLLMAPVFGGEDQYEGVRIAVVYDDISNSINPVAGLGALPAPAGTPVDDSTAAPGGTGPAGSDHGGSDSGHAGNGHSGSGGSSSGGGQAGNSDDSNSQADSGHSGSGNSGHAGNGNSGHAGNGHGNNGHGNNQDGVDSSNPGQGHGGPNGEDDQSCSGSGDCVDDEISH